jgi:hypothetical protein
MATFLKQGFAAEVKVGPFLDEDDGKTAEDGLTIEDEHVLLAKNGGDWAAKAETTTLAHESQGWYRCLLGTDDTDTLGVLMLQIHVAGALPVWREFHVLVANVYDSLFGGDKLQVHAVEISADLITATAIQDGALTADKFASDAITAAKVASDVGTEIATAVLAALEAAVVSGTADGGAAGSITLPGGASGSNDAYNGQVIVITNGTGAVQARKITDYVGSTKVATVSPNWATAPDNTSGFIVLAP